MNDSVILTQLRRFLLVFAGLLLIGALIELWFSQHTGEPLQLIPFGLCALGLTAIFLALLRPKRRTLQFLRISMGVVGLGSIFGMLVHIVNNVLFQEEIQPGLSLLEKISAGLGGANPLLAPGILGIAAVLALAAVYAHPSLSGQEGA